MNRRGFLRAALGATVGVVAGAELVEALSTRSIFLPPRGGWFGTANAGIPSFLTNYVDPQLLDYLARPFLVRGLGETDAELRGRMLSAGGVIKPGDLVTGPGIKPGTRIISSFYLTETTWRG